MAANRGPARPSAGGASARSGEPEISEQEYTRTINTAIANTEDEIFREATAEGALEHDGDTSLEEMGEGLEGDDLEEDAAEEGEGEGDGEATEGSEEADEGEAEGETQPQPRGQRTDDQPRDQRGQVQRRDGREQREPAVPPGRLRETTQRARSAEERNQTLERELAETRGRLDELSRRVNAPPQQQQQEAKADPEPDMFADPDGWKAWNRREAERIADDRAQRVLGGYRQEQQQQFETRLNTNLEAAATGPRGFEFNAAYRALVSLDPRDANARALVQDIIHAPNPSQALLDWFEDTGAADDFREQVLSQLMPQPQQRRQNGGNRQPQRQQQPQQQPRQVFRGPQQLRSLNGAQGSNSQRQADPEMLDGSDASVFDFATRR